MDPGDIGLKYEIVNLTTSDNTEIYGWYIPKKGAEYTVIFFHGNAGNISHRLDTIRIINELGFNMFIFDYRTYGKSKGRISEQGTYYDAEAAWEYITKEKQVPEEKVILWGRSLGGSIATYLAQDKNIKALILESTFTSVPDMGAYLYPFLPIRLLSRFKYDSKVYIKNVKVPVMIIHSPDDGVVPFKLGKDLFQYANEPKTFMEINGGHNEGFLNSETQYKSEIKKFLNINQSE